MIGFFLFFVFWKQMVDRVMNFGSHPVNLALRFILELAALFFFGFWGWSQGSGMLKIVWTVGLPLSMALLWGIFTVPGDPSRSGKAPVPVNGGIRLILELALFFLAFLAILDSDKTFVAAVFIFLVALHYFLSVDRIKWLLDKKRD